MYWKITSIMQRNNTGCYKQYLKLKQECIPVECVPPACCPYLRHALLRGVYLVPGGGVPGLGDGECTRSGGVPSLGDTWSQGDTWSRGDVPAQVPPCGQNHRRLWKYNLAPNFVAGGKKLYLLSNSVEKMQLFLMNMWKADFQHVILIWLCIRLYNEHH